LTISEILVLSNKKENYIKLFNDNLVNEAYVFGSVVTDKFNNQSDIDFIINFQNISDPVELDEKWWNIYYGLKDIFKRNIDIISENNLKNEYFISEIQKTKVKIYG